MMTGQDNVVIANRIIEEIVGLRAIRELDDLLCAAHVGQCKVRYQSAFGYEVTLQIA